MFTFELKLLICLLSVKALDASPILWGRRYSGHSKLAHHSIINHNSVCGNYRHDLYDSRSNMTSYFAHGQEDPFMKKYVSYQDGDIGHSLERLRNEDIVVKLNLVYDESFAAEYSGKALNEYLRNFIYSAQLFFEQPEMSSHVRINLVVISVKKSKLSLEPSWDVSKILRSFNAGPDKDPRADINVLVLFRTLWDTVPDGMKVLGLAHVGVLCHGNQPDGSLVITATPIGAAVTLAHELAHSFNVYHDGALLDDRVKIVESGCHYNKNIMSPSNGAGKVLWSECSVEAMKNYFLSKIDCIYNPDRLRDAVAVNDSFNFTRRYDNENRRKLPGISMPLDEQCSYALGKEARSSMTRNRRNGDGSYETCQAAFCIVKDKIEVGVGPALPGSQCNRKSDSHLGQCINSRCTAHR